MCPERRSEALRTTKQRSKQEKNTQISQKPLNPDERLSGLLLFQNTASQGEKRLSSWADSQAAGKRFVEYFTAHIRNRHTRRAYFQNVSRFSTWSEAHRLTLGSMEPVHVAAYVEELGRTHSRPTVKQHLAALRMLFDWLVVGQVIPVNPASSVRGPRHSVKKGKTSVLSAEEMRVLLESIDISTLIGLRDRALIALMGYTFARIGAALSIQVEDYYVQKRRGWVRLHEKGGKVNELPCHHNLETFLDEWLEASGLGKEPAAPMFPTLPHEEGGWEPGAEIGLTSAHRQRR